MNDFRYLMPESRLITEATWANISDNFFHRETFFPQETALYMYYFSGPFIFKQKERKPHIFSCFQQGKIVVNNEQWRHPGIQFKWAEYLQSAYSVSVSFSRIASWHPVSTEERQNDTDFQHETASFSASAGVHQSVVLRLKCVNHLSPHSRKIHGL